MVESKLLFTAERLRLNPQVVKGRLEGDRLTIKALDDRGYLTVDEVQWEVLRHFAEPRTVPDVLLQLIRERKVPALRDLFELILKAHRSGILQRGASHGILHPVSTWRLKVPRSIGGWLGGVAVALGIVSALVHPPAIVALDWPRLVRAGAVGLAAALVALSLGDVLAASALSHADGDVYRPRIRWSWLVPHFSVDLSDLRIMDGAARLQVHLSRLAPIAIAVVACDWTRPPWAFLPLVLFLGILRPVAGGVANEMITAVRGHPLLDTSHHMMFPPNRTWSGLIRAARGHFDSRVVVVRLIWGLVWIVAVLQVGFGAAGVPWQEVWRSLRVWEVTGRIFAAVLGVAALVLLYSAAAARAHPHVHRFVANRRLRRLRRRRPYQPVTGDTVSGAVALSPLCQHLSPPERDELARALRPVVIPVRRRLADFDRPCAEAWLIVSGAVDVFRRTPSGRIERAWQAVEGDLIGAEGLIESRPGGWRLWTRTPVVALAVSHEQLQELALRRIGPGAAHALVLWIPFLRQLHLCRNWHAQALLRFALLSTVARFPDGEVVLREDHDNQSLYMIYEGRAVITREGRRVATVGTGEFFGEIGMLQNSAATARVTARGPLTCLYLNRTEFLRFMSHNYEVALEIERVSSRRLGHPIFPMGSPSFDVY